MIMGVKKFFISMFLFASLSANAQFTDVDWSQARRDSLLPECVAVMPLPADYEGYDYTVEVEYPEYREMTADEVAIYGLQACEGRLQATPVVETSVSIAAKKPMLDVSFLPVIMSGGKYYRIDSYKLVLNRSAKPTQPRKSQTRAATSRYAGNSVLATGRWVKIRVSERGIHQITAEQLSKMGFTNPSKVRLYGYGGNILPKTNIHTLVDDLCEVPLWRENGRLLFYANGTTSWAYASGRYVRSENYYSTHGYYFLTESNDAPMQFPVAAPQASYSSTNITYPDYELYEKDAISLCNYGNVMLDDYNFAKGRTKQYSFSLPEIAGVNLIVDIAFGSSAEESTKLAVEVNGTRIGNMGIPRKGTGDLGKIASARYSSTAGAANTVVTLTHSVSTASVSGFLDYISLNFTRNLVMRGSQINFRGKSSATSNAKFVIGGATATTRVWSVSKADGICQVAGELSGGDYSVIAPASYSDEYVAFNTAGIFPDVEVVGVVPNQDLHSLGQTDMVIIVPSSGNFLAPAERLAEAHRTMDGLTVAVVTADQVYNEFSSGTSDATAYRRLMKMLYDRADDAAAAPKYLLLFGDGCADNRLLSYQGRSTADYLLTFQSDNSTNAIYSYVLEDYYGFLDDAEGSNLLRDKVDVGVGRIPVVSLAQANVVVNKTIAYMENKEAGDWQNVISFLGDDGDDDLPNQHMIDAESVATVVEQNYPSYIIDRIYWDDYEPVANSTGNSYPVVTSAIYDRLNTGALVVNYSGHGSATMLAHEMVWLATDMQALKSPRLPFWVTASCDIGPFDIGDNSLAELAIVNPNGGAVGFLATTRTVRQVHNAVINRAFMGVLLSPFEDGRRQAVGDALRRAKNNVITSGNDLSENKLSFVLLGDPALRLKLPEYKIVVDKFNGGPATASSNVSAGGMLSVEGYVADADGNIVPGYKGVISTSLFDSAEDIYTRDNLGYGPFNYTAYNKKLFVGSDSVKNGRFNIEMPVPMDISYSGERGMLNLFAIDNSKSALAQGHYDNFVMAGTSSSATNDGKGPEITMYLNTPMFYDGGEVNSTPFLFAKLYDENGINTVGTGVGHDIMLIVDNDPNHTYNLNNVYTPVVGDYKNGTIQFSLNALAPGYHTLMLRAWDLYNNSSVEELSFVVVPNLAPNFTSIKLSPNPARYGQVSTFVLTHDFPQSAVDVTIEVFNFQGQTIWRNTEQAVCEGNTYTYDWNVTSQSGQPMPTGVYLYRATMSSGGSSEVTKTGKFVVINNK
ncbi:MAG: type IX secretion system sortase PorU [Bacteroidaceae bacterium]|nr:type IX secretion system sortase PorU [Bacteroidaceae bacterium]